MKRERVSREQFMAAAARPRRRYAALDLNRSNAVRLHQAFAAPCYWFERRQELVLLDGSYAIDRKRATITMFVDGAPAVLFYLVGPRLDSCTFTFNLSSQQLGGAVAAMRRARLAALVPLAASSALENLPGAQRPILEEPLRSLARAGPKRRGDAASQGGLPQRK